MRSARINLGSLERIDVSHNALRGTIPSELGQLEDALILVEGNADM